VKTLFLNGTSDLLVLSILDSQDSYMYEIVKSIIEYEETTVVHKLRSSFYLLHIIFFSLMFSFWGQISALPFSLPCVLLPQVLP